MVHVLRTAETHVLFTVFIDTLGVDHYWTERQKSQGADMRPVWRTVNTSAHRVLEDLAGGLYSPKFFSQWRIFFGDASGAHLPASAEHLRGEFNHRL